MNAQEAIDLMERELENYKAMYKKHMKEQTTLEQFYKNKVEALSIVLESAKDFHKLIGLGKPWSFRDLYIPFIKYETMFSYTLTDLKGIGIEKGEDE